MKYTRKDLIVDPDDARLEIGAEYFTADLNYSLIYEGFCRIDCKKKYVFDSCPYAK